MSKWIDNKCVIISGASSGMGKELTKRLIEEHNCFVIGIARNKEKMETLVEELGSKKCQFTYQLFDVSKLENWIEFKSFLTENEYSPDVLINNAGILPAFDRLINYSFDEIHQIMNINFFSCVYAIKTLAPLILKSENPAIINIDSSAALMSLAGTSVYTASKAALRGLTEAIREEMRGQIYVGLVCPGFTKTEIFRAQTQSGGEKAFDLISTPCDKMVDRILKGILRKKEFMTYGFDGKMMNFFGRLMPVRGGKLFSLVMKKSKLPLFSTVFECDTTKKVNK